MINIVIDNNEMNRIGYYSIIPATVLYNKELKPNAKLLYAIITSLSNKEGYCYASNKYLGEKLGVDPTTVSRWLKDLRKNNFIFVEIVTNEKKEVICRKIFPHDIPYMQNNQYPYMLKNQQGIDDNNKDNNINNNNINTHTVSKKNYAEKVSLYDYEYEKLISQYGEKKANKCIEELDLYKRSKGIEYEDDYATIQRWVVARVEEIESRKEVKNNKKKNYSNYEQREYSAEFFESLYDNFSGTKEEMKESEEDMEM